MGQLLEGCKKGVGSDAKLTWADAEFLEKQEVQPWMNMPVWVPPVGEMAYMGRISRDRAVKAGLTFRPVADTARDTLAWWKTLPEERRAKPKAGISAEREQSVLTAWHAKK
ncbi:MAG: dependent epimerase/dehydratase family protein [Myxococcales bacterium]|nr:dependent epimerase/dehydratase family protein [Myxococcales bacterium]